MSQFVRVWLTSSATQLDAEYVEGGTKHAFTGDRLKEPTKDKTFFTPLTERMLKWEMRVKRHPELVMQERDAQSYRECLKALMELEPFTSVVTMEVDRENCLLQPTNYDWCHIYFYSRRVARFTHDDNGGKFLVFASWPQENLENVLKWDSGRWRAFFLQHIKDKALKAKKAAEAAMDAVRDKQIPIVAMNTAVLEHLPAL